MICDSWLKFEDLLVKNFELYRMLLLNILLNILLLHLLLIFHYFIFCI